jgi:hypothetical protein
MSTRFGSAPALDSRAPEPTPIYETHRCSSCHVTVADLTRQSRFFPGTLLCEDCKAVEDRTPSIPRGHALMIVTPSPNLRFSQQPGTVRKSTFVGNQSGLFTTRLVRRHELIAYFSGDDRGPIIADERKGGVLGRAKMFGTPGRYMEDGGTASGRQKHIGCYANSARSPEYFNAELRWVMLRDPAPPDPATGIGMSGRYGVVASRDIEAGHEVLVDYGGVGTGVDINDPWWAPSDAGAAPHTIAGTAPTAAMLYAIGAILPPDPIVITIGNWEDRGYQLVEATLAVRVRGAFIIMQMETPDGDGLHWTVTKARSAGMCCTTRVIRTPESMADVLRFTVLDDSGNLHVLDCRARLMGDRLGWESGEFVMQN